MTNYDVIKKLTGKIEPVGESHTDDKRLENLKETVVIVEQLLNDIYQVAKNESRHEHSMKVAGKYAREYLKAWGDYCH